MDLNKRQRLEAAGWQVGTVKDFLDLEESETKLIEFKATLIELFKLGRESKKLSQSALAEKMQSSQSRVAKIEAGDTSVSIDLIMRGLFSLGLTQEEIAQNLISKTPRLL
jgi:DNA-binding XRE family transcriptional regulator